ncbi:MAG: TIGR04211 family SH3 domain-containing protein [Succinivibrio sp.]
MKTFFKICAISVALSSSIAFAVEQNSAQEAETSASAEPINVAKPSSIEEVQVGDEIYVSDAANVWLRTCSSTNCRIVAATHVGESFKFVKLSEDKKFVLVDDGNRQLWMQTRDLQTEPCGKAKVALLEGEIAKLKNDLENYDSIVAKDFHAAKTKLEKLESENAKLKEVLSKQNEQIEELDATRRDYADKLETKELDMQMRWWLQGAIIAFCGAIIGIICVYIPRPNKKRKQPRF